MSVAPAGFQAGRHGSLVEHLLEQYQADPERTAVIFVRDDGSEEAITVRQLHDRAGAWALSLREAGTRPGDIVILALRHCRELLAAFWGCLCAGNVPAIVAYKSPMTVAADYIARLKNLAAQAGPRVIITLPELASEAERSLAGTGCQIMAVEKDEARGSIMPLATSAVPAAREFTSGEGIAYLQFTSGSSGSQKGVLLSHRAILNQVQSQAAAVGIGAKDKVVNWLPLYHDFGLFAGFLMPFFSLIPCILLSPFKWLRDPAFLLKLIQRHRGTISFMPNSALNHTVRHMAGTDAAGLDLGSLRMLINGSEPVLYESQQDFLACFAPFGFRESALASGYGMAENTLGITCSETNKRGPVDWVWARSMHAAKKALPAPASRAGAKPHVSSGTAMENMEVAIIDEQGRRLPERSLGEIIVKSPSLFSGYHGQPERTAAALKGGWYHTGDSGYIAAGHLYVCGRMKDLIIVGGHNIHPEELERIAVAVPGIREDRTVALGIADEALGTEQIVMICGLERPATAEEKAAMEKELRGRIRSGLEIVLGEVHFVDKKWIERTHNGKIARAANLEKYKKLNRPA